GGDTGQSLGVGPPPPSSACTHRPRGRRLTPDDYPDTIRPDWCGCCGAGGLSSSPKTRRLLRPQQAPFPTAGTTNPLLGRWATASTIFRGREHEPAHRHCRLLATPHVRRTCCSLLWRRVRQGLLEACGKRIS